MKNSIVVEKKISLSIDAISSLLAVPFACIKKRQRWDDSYHDNESIDNLLFCVIERGFVLEHLYLDFPREKLKRTDIEWSREYLKLYIANHLAMSDQAGDDDD